jgi:hypothetical protein
VTTLAANIRHITTQHLLELHLKHLRLLGLRGGALLNQEIALFESVAPFTKSETCVAKLNAFACKTIRV